VAVGDGKILDNGQKLTMSLKAGDRILLGKYAGTEVKLDGEEYLLMREDEVLGVLTGKKTKVLA
jgi:chaperonin GroES